MGNLHVNFVRLELFVLETRITGTDSQFLDPPLDVPWCKD